MFTLTFHFIFASLQRHGAPPPSWVLPSTPTTPFSTSSAFSIHSLLWRLHHCFRRRILVHPLCQFYHHFPWLSLTQQRLISPVYDLSGGELSSDGLTSGRHSSDSGTFVGPQRPLRFFRPPLLSFQPHRSSRGPFCGRGVTTQVVPGRF